MTLKRGKDQATTARFRSADSNLSFLMIFLQTKTCMVVQYSNGSENSLKNKHVLEKHARKRPVGAPLKQTEKSKT